MNALPSTAHASTHMHERRSGNTPPGVDLHIPFPVRISPHRETAREAALSWLQKHEILRSPKAVADWKSWDVPLMMAVTFPDATEQGLINAAKFHSLAFLIDDQFDPEEKGRDKLLHGVAHEIVAIMFRQNEAPLGLSTPATRAYQDIWREKQSRMSPAWCDRFAANCARWLLAYLRETTFVDQWLTVEDYIPLRRLTVGIHWCLDQSEWTAGFEVPAQVAALPAFQAMRHDTVDAVAFTNDIQSELREKARHEAQNNLVLTLQHQHGCSLHEARRRAATMTEQAIASFVRRATELLDICQGMHLSPTELQAVEASIEGCRSWIAGNYYWGEHTGRYRDIGGPAYNDDILA